MKREEILEKSRNENLSADPYTAEVEKKQRKSAIGQVSLLRLFSWPSKGCC